MSDYILYHKTNCQTSLSTLKLLKEHGVQPELRLYLDDVPTQKELSELIKKLGCKAIDIVRTKEPIYKEQYKDKTLTKKEWLKVLTEHPILINRPILVKGDKAIFCRPPEVVLDFI